MRILLCLLSDQHVPNLLSVHHFRPDRLVLLESAAMRKRNAAANLVAALAAGGIDFHRGAEPHAGNLVVESLSHEDSLRDVQAALKSAYGRFPSDEWIVNITGGTKPMSIAAFEFFRNLGASLIYVNNSRPDTFIWLDAGREETCTHRPAIREWLLGYGFDLVKPSASVAAAEERALRWAQCASTIARHAGPYELVAWTDCERNSARKDQYQLKPQHATEFLRKPEIASSVAQALNLSLNSDGLSGSLDKYAGRFLSGEWLEVFFWNLLRTHQQALGLWDVRLGLAVGGAGSQSPNDNEFDVSFMHRHNLNMIECKSGKQSADPATKVLYQIEAVMQQFRALRVRKYLATTAETLFARGATDIRPGIQRRAELFDCRLIGYPQIQRLAQPGATASDVAQILEISP